jgi:hypothetical protein
LGKIKDAVMGEAQHYTHTSIEAITETVLQTGTPMQLSSVIAAAFIDGLEIGARLTAGDVVCGRRLVATLEKAAKVPVGVERATIPAADRLLAALSK